MIKPLFNNVVVKPAEKEVKTAAGIYIAESAAERPQLGEIIAIGDVKNMKVGDKVYYKRWGGNEIKEGNEEYLIIEDKDILAIHV
jgi:chaperonin GroES